MVLLIGFWDYVKRPDEQFKNLNAAKPSLERVEKMFSGSEYSESKKGSKKFTVISQKKPENNTIGSYK